MQEQLSAFKDVTRRGFQEIRNETRSLNERIDVLEGARSETWELVSQQLNTTLDRTVNSLSERMLELENAMQSQGTTPSTRSDQLHINPEEFATLEPSRSPISGQESKPDIRHSRKKWIK